MYKNICDNIRSAREEIGLTQEEMSEIMNISRTAYRNIESGRTKMVSDRLISIAEATGKTTDELVLGYAPQQVSQSLYQERDNLLEENKRLKTELERISNEKDATINALLKALAAKDETIKVKDEIINLLNRTSSDAD